MDALPDDLIRRVFATLNGHNLSPRRWQHQVVALLRVPSVVVDRLGEEAQRRVEAARARPVGRAGEADVPAQGGRGTMGRRWRGGSCR